MFSKGYYITAELKIKDMSRLDETVKETKKLCVESVKEPGCSIFIAHHDNKDSDKILLWERFDSESDFNYHFEQRHTKDFVSKDLTQIVQYSQSNVI